VNISIPTIIKDLNVSVGLGSLVIISFLLTITILVLIMGRIADRYGFRKVFLWGFFIFGTGSALSGLAPDIYFLIGARIIQATGIAMLASVGPAIITCHLPQSTLGKSLGYLIACAALGYALGPGIGGIMSHYLSWRWIFFLNLPIIVVGLVMGMRFIPKDPQKKTKIPVDPVGALLSAIAIGGVLSSFSLFQVPGVPDLVLVLFFVTGVCAGILLLRHEKKSPHPFIFPGVTKNRNFLLGITSCFIVMALFSGVTYLLPIYLINSRHLDPFIAGLIMMVPALCSLIVAPISGSLSDKYGSPIVSAIAIGISAIGALVIFTFNPATGILIIVIGVLITRVSTAAFFGPNGKLIMENCPRSAMGSGSGLMMMVRHAGLVCGIAMFQSVFAIRMYVEGVSRDGTPLVPRLTPQMSVLGYQAVYFVMFCLCIAVVILSLMARNPDGVKRESKEESGTSDFNEYF
jgi:EmrB/QacA subfamily drug resistance transporter